MRSLYTDRLAQTEEGQRIMQEVERVLKPIYQEAINTGVNPYELHGAICAVATWIGGEVAKDHLKKDAPKTSETAEPGQSDHAMLQAIRRDGWRDCYVIDGAHSCYRWRAPSPSTVVIDVPLGPNRQAVYSDELAAAVVDHYIKYPKEGTPVVSVAISGSTDPDPLQAHRQNLIKWAVAHGWIYEIVERGNRLTTHYVRPGATKPSYEHYCPIFNDGSVFMPKEVEEQILNHRQEVEKETQAGLTELAPSQEGDADLLEWAVKHGWRLQPMANTEGLATLTSPDDRLRITVGLDGSGKPMLGSARERIREHHTKWNALSAEEQEAFLQQREIDLAVAEERRAHVDGPDLRPALTGLPENRDPALVVGAYATD